MGAVHLVTDSTCYLPADVIAKYDIRIVPLRVNWSTESLREGVDIKGKKLFDRLRKRREVTTTSKTPAG